VNTSPIVKTNGLALHVRQSPSPMEPLSLHPVVPTQGMVRRRITPQAGRGLEILGHALDYLKDEFVYDGCRFDEDRGRLHAIQLLASLNRQIYFACGVEPTMRERVQSLLRHVFRQPGCGISGCVQGRIQIGPEQQAKVDSHVRPVG
jgi:hypothetical protein